MANPCGPLNIRPLDCATDSVTVCAVEPIQVVIALNCETDSVTVCPPASGIFEVGLDAPSLAALETVTVLQGTIPWEVSGTFTTTSPDEWAINHAPASAATATATRPPVVGQRHHATAISFSVITTTTAPTVATLTVTLRDGASGAGTVLMVWRVRVSAAMTDQNVAQVTLGGLNVVGSVNTAMTLEFDVGTLNTLEDVSLTGYTVAQLIIYYIVEEGWVNGYLLSENLYRVLSR